MGMVVVACMAARVAGTPPVVTITSTGKLDQLSRKRRQSIGLTLHVAAYQDEVLPFHIAQFAKPLQEHCMQVLFISPPAPFQPANLGAVRWWLRLSSERDSSGEGEDDKESDGAALHGVVLQNTQQDHKPEVYAVPV